MNNDSAVGFCRATFSFGFIGRAVCAVAVLNSACTSDCRGQPSADVRVEAGAKLEREARDGSSAIADREEESSPEVVVIPSQSDEQLSSIVSLIARPERYDGRPVRVVGYLVSELEGDALYLERDDAAHGITKNAIALNLYEDDGGRITRFGPYSQFGWHEYAIVEGVFRAPSPNGNGLFSGAIGHVSRIDAWHAAARDR